MTDKPFTAPLILIWGPGETCEHRIGDKNLYDKRLELKQSLQEYYSKEGRDTVVAFSEDEELSKFTEDLKKFGAADIHAAEAKQVSWSTLIICLDDPRVRLTVQTEITGILRPFLDSRWRERPEFLKKVIVFEPVSFLKAEADTITPPGSIALANILEARERLHDVIDLRPYTDDEFERCELKKDVVRAVEALRIRPKLEDLSIIE
jgi:hypothetical protein